MLNQNYSFQTEYKTVQVRTSMTIVMDTKRSIDLSQALRAIFIGAHSFNVDDLNMQLIDVLRIVFREHTTYEDDRVLREMYTGEEALFNNEFTIDVNDEGKYYISITTNIETREYSLELKDQAIRDIHKFVHFMSNRDVRDKLSQPMLDGLAFLNEVVQSYYLPQISN